MSLTSILVEWDPSFPLKNDTIGYQIDYTEERGNKTNFQSETFKAVSGGADWFLLQNLTPGATYRISMRGLSSHFHSNFTPPSVITLTTDTTGSTDKYKNTSSMFCKKQDSSQHNTSVDGRMHPNGFLNETTAENNSCSSDKAINNIGLTTGALLVGLLLGAVVSGVGVALICKRHSKAR